MIFSCPKYYLLPVCVDKIFTVSGSNFITLTKSNGIYCDFELFRLTFYFRYQHTWQQIICGNKFMKPVPVLWGISMALCPLVLHELNSHKIFLASFLCKDPYIKGKQRLALIWREYRDLIGLLWIFQGPLLWKWINFNPSMYKKSHVQ